MKSLVSGYGYVKREIEAYKALQAKAKATVGMSCVRLVLDHFILEREHRKFHFLIHEPLGVTAEVFLGLCGGSFPVSCVKDFAYRMLQALEFIHKAQVVHTDLQARNILFQLQDPTVFREAEEAEVQHPSSRKITDQATIFETRKLPGDKTRWLGKKSEPVLCDFGLAHTGKTSHTGIVQPDVYRAPEVFLGLPWGTAVDIWNLGCMIWEFMFDHHLFSDRHLKGATPVDERTADRDQLARMASLLGQPPQELLLAPGPAALEFFNEDRSAKGNASNETLESAFASCLARVNKTMSPEESKAFLAFIKRTLTWMPDKRPSASELLKDPWLKSVIRRG
ncbi:hypothetical protein H0H92_013055 [Tricholoma furcatifolium]|nr:hypothetical protein H0H92_013055 [Tricholoma furcatifolium]